MKKKIKDFTLEECKKICDKQSTTKGSCKHCLIYNWCGSFSHLWSSKPTIETEVEIDEK